MKKLKSIVVGLVFAFYVGGSTLAIPVSSYAALEEISTDVRADVIEWRYKIENSKLYKRQYNYSKQIWVGDWIFVSNVIE